MSREISMNYNESIKQFTISDENGIIAYGGTMEECLENYKVVACKCAPALCPELTIDIVGDEKMVTIVDDFQHAVCMTVEQFEIMATKFLQDRNNGII